MAPRRGEVVEDRREGETAELGEKVVVLEGRLDKVEERLNSMEKHMNENFDDLRGMIRAMMEKQDKFLEAGEKGKGANPNPNSLILNKEGGNSMEAPTVQTLIPHSDAGGLQLEEEARLGFQPLPDGERGEGGGRPLEDPRVANPWAGEGRGGGGRLQEDPRVANPWAGRDGDEGGPQERSRMWAGGGRRGGSGQGGDPRGANPWAGRDGGGGGLQERGRGRIGPHGRNPWEGEGDAWAGPGDRRPGRNWGCNPDAQGGRGGWPEGRGSEWARGLGRNPRGGNSGAGGGRMGKGE